MDGGDSASARENGIHTQSDSVKETRRNGKEADDRYFDEAVQGSQLNRLSFLREEALSG